MKIYRIYSFSGEYSDYLETTLGYVLSEEEATSVSKRLTEACEKYRRWRKDCYEYINRRAPRQLYPLKWGTEEYEAWNTKRRTIEAEFSAQNPEPPEISFDGVSWEEVEPYTEKEGL